MQNLLLHYAKYMYALNKTAIAKRKVFLVHGGDWKNNREHIAAETYANN
jgi:hypothetical protein